MKKMISLIVAMALCSSITACTGPADDTGKTSASTTTVQEATSSAETEEESSAETTTEKAASEEDAILGKYTPIKVKSGDVVESGENFKDFFSLEMNPEGKCKFKGGAEILDCTWSYEDKKIIIEGKDFRLQGEIGEDTICLKDFGGASDITFAKEGSKAATETETLTDEKQVSEESTSSEASDEKASEDKEETGSQASAGEPIPKGDGKLSKEDGLRLLRYYEYCHSVGLPLHYEDMVEFAGCEGEDGGNDGENVMTKFGDRLARWYAGDPRAYVYFTFRRPDDKDDWTARQWVSQNMDSADVEAADISEYLEKKLEKPEISTKEFAMTVKGEGGSDEISLKLKMDIPEAGWFVDDQSESFKKIKLYHTYATEDQEDYGKIIIEAYDSKDSAVYDLNTVEEATEVDAITVSGATLSGIHGKSAGEQTTYWYGQLENGVWIGVTLRGLDMADADRVMALVNSISVE